MNSPRPWLFIAMLVAATAASAWAIENIIKREAAQDARAEVLAQLSTIRARIEGAIHSNTALVGGLVAEIALDPGITQARFADLARILLRENHQVLNIGAARDLVITHIYPVEGNERALGLDYRRNPQQQAAALRARDEGRLVIAGPVNLVQGGSGLIGRAPVFLTAPGTGGRGKFWGLVSTVIDVESVYRISGLTSPQLPLSVALSGRDGRGVDGEVFFGDTGVLSADPVRVDVVLPSARWQLAGIPHGGWEVDPVTVWPVRGLAVVLAVLCILIVGVRERALRERHSAMLELQQVRKRLADAIESISDGFALWDAEDRLVVCNARHRDLYKTVKDALIPGARFEDLLRLAVASSQFDTADDAEEAVQARLRMHRSGKHDHEVRLHDGRIIQMREYLASDGSVVGIHTDVTDLRQAEADVRHRAYYDELTGLPNRAHFREQLEGAIARSHRSGRMMALLFVDLDRFKIINDTLGHQLGDKILVESAERIRSAVRASDTVARLGGDEFTIVLESLDDALGATLVAESVLGKLSAPHEIDGNRLHCGASIGVTLCPGDGDDADTLLKNADMAMYEAKDHGRDTFRYFTAEMTRRAQAFLSLEGELRRAIERHEFILHYQPIYDLREGRIVKAEALVRWEHPERGLVMPGEFIPAAEESGLIVEIGRQVLEMASAEAVGWAALSRDGLQPGVSVNVSSRQFSSGFGAETLRACLEAHRLDPQHLTIEITESLLMDERMGARSVLRELREIGVGLVLDDFGTGYSSLSYLRRFPVTGLKIDRSFVGDIETDPNDARLVESIVTMGRGLGLEVVAEGVETAAQEDALRQMGCPFAQGYLFARPMSAQAFRAVLLGASDESGGPWSNSRREVSTPLPPARKQVRITG